ncbi:uncharacterized protein LOC123566305 isoform X4 [Mercenaria mercenaria]|uniref:uncharacterized protein LOC123566305 isoform X4 n=1 Tax=Mercenaria mercenaria TaxID=6596 RepID=UPI00234F6A77|nr:uncharacterized protein LOC123566305 isoform X4 [Mercenaria mercenaria]
MLPPSLWEYQPNWTLLTFNILILLGKVLGSREHRYDYYPSPRPKFLPGGSNFTFHQGDTATLTCGVMDLGTKTVSWRRDSSLQPLAIGEMIFSPNTDYKIHHPENSFYWNLLIKNVQPKHADTYECQISTGDKMKRRMHLNVIDDDTFRKPAEKPKIKRVPEGDKLQANTFQGDSSGSTSGHVLSEKFLFIVSTLFVVYLILWSHDAS